MNHIPGARKKQRIAKPSASTCGAIPLAELVASRLKGWTESSLTKHYTYDELCELHQLLAKALRSRATIPKPKHEFARNQSALVLASIFKLNTKILTRERPSKPSVALPAPKLPTALPKPSLGAASLGATSPGRMSDAERKASRARVLQRAIDAPQWL
jgi:hypothetical protein